MSLRKFTKHTKKRWRKSTNSKDVEENITEQQRRQLLTDLAVNKKDDELFAIEPSSHSKNSSHKKFQLRSEYHCANNSLVALPVHPSKNNHAFSDTSDDEIDIPNESMCYHLNYTMANDVKKRGLKSLRKCLIDAKPTDIWSESSGTNKTSTYLKNLPQRPGTVRYSNRASIEIPHSGTSYNPSFTDHQRLLQRATNDEERKLRKLEKLHSSMKMPKMDHEDRERQWLLELTEGLNNDELSEEEIENDNTTKILKFPTKRKTSQQKRKEKLRKKALLQQKAVKIEKKRLNDVYRIKSLKKEICAKEKLLEENMLRRSLKKDMYRTKRIGKFKYEKPLVDVQLSSELSGSLRLLQSTGSLMTDRFVSLQRRNMVEPKGSIMKSRRSHKKPKK